ncbi:GNAT family N-acetyltransferase [Terasakiella sp. SH-1]|uniref:GNAT family N-acetyltransferase n=1 Tax=Terasakiella sp. SH-1 TaxID=2560057 RepID=UPI001073959F|nr:GNAT family N-acetyltransferase [Terasakiella sp. SH-1]
MVKLEGSEKVMQKKISSKAVAIRFAKSQQDIDKMIDLGRKLHAESWYRHLPMDDARMQEIGHRGLKDGNPGLIIAERGDEMVGMAIVVLGEYYFSAVRTATVQLFYVIPEARGGSAALNLLRALRLWAKEAEANDLHVNVTTGIEPVRTDHMLRKLGFKQTGGNYVLESL